MLTEYPGGAGRPGADSLEPLAVSPRQACVLLGVGTTRLYQLIRDGELVTYHEGRARRVTMASIRARVARLAGAGGNGSTPPPHHHPLLPHLQPRRPGRPRKGDADRVAP
jgi:excisionase family DNA binding protein